MRVLHIIPTYYPAYARGGPIWSVHNLNKWLAKKGIDVTVYTTDIDIPESIPKNQEVNVDGVKVFYFPISFATWEYSRDLHFALRHLPEKFDLVHITSVFLSASALGAHYAKKFKKPYVISPRGSLMKDPLAMKNRILKKLYLQLVEKKNIEGAAAIHFTTEQERREYESAGLPSVQNVVIPNSFDEGGFNKEVWRGIIRNKFGISENVPIVLFLSRISWKKGLDTLIPAFAEVIKKVPNAVLLLAGPDDEHYSEEIMKMIKEVNKKNHDVLNVREFDLEKNNPHKSDTIRINPRQNIIFTGMLTGDDRIAAYKDADVFVLPSYSENFGMAVIEALSLGLPTVITEGVAISGLIKKKEAGVVVRKEVYEVARAIVDVLKNKGKFLSMIEKGKKLVMEEFSPKIVAERFEEAYKEIIRE